MFGEENCKTMKKILLLILLGITISLTAQTNARYGCGYAPYGLSSVFFCSRLLMLCLIV